MSSCVAGSHRHAVPGGPVPHLASIFNRDHTNAMAYAGAGCNCPPAQPDNHLQLSDRAADHRPGRREPVVCGTTGRDSGGRREHGGGLELTTG
jgi:hypothetical protein